MDVAQLSLAELTRVCREETSRFLRNEPAGDEHCWEIFRRAVTARDARAWEAIVLQYQGMVLSWLRRHPAAPIAREDDDYWINRSFERFWSAVGPERFSDFPNLRAMLRYLKMCCHSVLLDDARSRAGTRLEPLTDSIAEASEAPDTAGAVIDQLGGQALWQAVAAEAGNEAERLVVRLCLVLDLKPREVFERHPDIFPSVADVYRTKRNLLDRLRRSPTIRAFAM